MNELNNIATAVGNYNNISTSLTSNLSVVNIVDRLILTKDADKKNWSSGNLTYTIEIDNQTDTAYTQPVITDTIDNSLVEFVEKSVTINGVAADESKYSYNTDTHTLTIDLDDVSPSSKTTVTFLVKKKNQ